MHLPLQITFRNLPASPSIEATIRARADRLDQFASDIMRCEVTIEVVGKHRHQGRRYAVHIDLTLAGAEIVISRNHENEDVAVALRAAFDAAARKLEDHVQVRRGDVKRHVAPINGRTPS
jgi:ribosomal subunit interface protein